MAIKQTYICDGCNLVIETAVPFERLKVKISGIPENADINAIKDVCSYACTLRIIADLVALPTVAPANGKPDISVDELDLSIRVAHWLQTHEIKTVNQLCEFDIFALPRLKRPNKRMMRELIEQLEVLNRKLNPKGWVNPGIGQ